MTLAPSGGSGCDGTLGGVADRFVLAAATFRRVVILDCETVDEVVLSMELAGESSRHNSDELFGLCCCCCCIDD